MPASVLRLAHTSATGDAGLFLHLPLAAAVIRPDNSPGQCNQAWKDLFVTAEWPFLATALDAKGGPLPAKTSPFLPPQHYAGPPRTEVLLEGDDGRSLRVRVFRSPLPERLGGGAVILCEHIVGDPLAAQADPESTLDEGETLFRNLTETTTSAIFIIKGKTFEYMNPQGEELCGYSRAQLRHMNFWDIVHPAHKRTVKRFGLDLMRGRTVEMRFELKIVTPAGKEHWLDFSARHMTYQGEPAVLGTAVDITARKNMELALKQAEEKYRNIFEYAGDGIFQSTLEGRFLQVNPAMAAIFGYESPEQMVRGVRNIGPQLYLDPEDRVRFMDTIVSQGSNVKQEVHMRRRNGEHFWALISSQVVVDDEGTPLYVAGVLSDITERKAKHEELQRKATHDGLTGAPNRYLFMDRLQQALSHANRYHTVFALLYIDLDDFKVVNDTHGHALGDDALRLAARRLRQHVRESDTLARMGGDEFCLLVNPLKRPEDAAAVAVHLVQALETPLRVNDVDIRLGASIGISLHPKDGNDAGELLDKADSAMYRIKNQGGRGCCFYSSADI